jgi:hypothetical protein
MKKYLTYLLRLVLIIFVAAIALSPLFTNLAELGELGLTPRGFLPIALNANNTPTPPVTSMPTNTSTPAGTPTNTSVPMADVRITFILYDPPGPDINGEYIEFRNFGNVPQNLLGWWVQNMDGFNSNDEGKVLHVFDFPDFDLQPGAIIRLWSKMGVADGMNFYWDQTIPVWENDGDFARLVNDSGQEVDFCQYTGGGQDTSC